MTDLKILIPAVLVYLAVVLLIPVKKGGQPALPWFLSICLQAATMLLFPMIKAKITGLVPTLLYMAGSDLYFSDGEYGLITAALCILVNLLFILIVNRIYVGQEKRRAEKNEQRMRSSMTAEQAAEAARAEQLQKDIAAAAISINSSGSGDQKTGKRPKKERGTK